MAIGFWLRRPRVALARLRYYFWERANPDKPWLCPGTIAFCERHLDQSMRALEFGSGRSTRWFAKRVGHLTSIEHDAAWYEVVKTQLAGEQVENVDYRLIRLNHPESEPEHVRYALTPDYVAIADQMPDASLNFVVVDGHYRTTCVRHVLAKISPGGYLLVDDVNMWPSPEQVGVPEKWPVLDDSSNGVKRCIIWQSRS
jgi:hypothetical protein